MWEILGILIIVAVIFGLLAFKSRYVLVPPNKAMVVFGRKSKGGKGVQIRTGGGKFVMPIIESWSWLDLGITTLNISVTDVVTKEGVMLDVEAVTQTQIDPQEDSLQTASVMLLTKTSDEIEYVAKKTLEGHVRGVCATLTIEQINADRAAVSEQILKVAVEDLRNMGLNVVSFTIRDLMDKVGYLYAMGKRRTAEVKRDAIIGQANANMEAQRQSAIRAKEGDIAEAEAVTKTREAQALRDKLTQEYETEVEIAKAVKDQTYDIEKQKKQKELVQAEMEKMILEREKQIELAEKEMIRKEREQDASVRVPARASADQEAFIAEGAARALMQRGTAEADVVKLKGKADADVDFMRGEAEAKVEKVQGMAQADVISAKGLAEAEAIRAKGLAEAEAMNKKADAWKEYGNAAIAQIVVDKLPEIAEKLALPLENTEKLIIMGSESGGSRLVSDSVNSLVQISGLMQSLTGVDLTDVGKNLLSMNDPKGKKVEIVK
jgi:flotillin